MKYSLANNSFCLFFALGYSSYQVWITLCVVWIQIKIKFTHSGLVSCSLPPSSMSFFPPQWAHPAELGGDSQQFFHLSVQCYFRFPPASNTDGVIPPFTCVTAHSRNTAPLTCRDVLAFSGRKKSAVRSARVILSLKMLNTFHELQMLLFNKNLGIYCGVFDCHHF